MELLVAIVLAVCVVGLGRLLLGERLRWRFDAALSRAARRLQRGAGALQRRVGGALRRPAERRRAKRAAAEAIRRARRPDGHWDGNVFHAERPDKKRRTLH